MQENFYREIIEEMPMGYAYNKVICDADGMPCDYEFLETNRAFTQLTGLDGANIRGKRVSEVFPKMGENEFDWIKFFGEVAFSGGKKECRQFSRSLGKWYKVTVHSPKKMHLITAFYDVSDEQQQWVELNNFFRVNLDLLCIADTSGNFIKVNKEWEKILGYSVEYLEKNSFLDFVHPDDIGATMDEIAKLQEQKQVLNFVNRYRCKDGSYKYIEWRSMPHGDRIYAAARDITEQKCIEDDLRKSKSELGEIVRCLEFVLNRTKTGVSVIDRDLNLRYVSHSWKNIYGEPGNKKCYEYFVELETLCANCGANIAFETGEMVQTEQVLMIKGQQRIYSVYAIPYQSDDGERLVAEFKFNITESKRVEHEIQQKANFQKIVAEASSEFVRASADNIDEKIKTMLQAVGCFLAVDRAYLFAFSHDNKVMTNTHEWCSEGISSQREYMQDFPLDALPWWKEMIKGRAFIAVNDVAELPKAAAAERDEFQRQGIKSIVAVPLVAHDGFVKGFLGIDAVTEKVEWDEFYISCLQLLVNIVVDAQLKVDAEEALTSAKEKAENASNVKSQFLANMSHEIRTPMNGIVGFLQLLETSEMTDTQKDFVKAIKVSSDTLLTVINDILDISKIEAGKIELEEISFNLVAAIETSVIPFLEPAKAKGLDINILIHSDVPNFVLGDPTRLKQVIANLVNNAVKFTNQGDVLLEAVLLSRDYAKYEIKFIIQDSGIGISEDAIKRMFLPFSQADTSLTRKYGGTGLGLAICKSIVEMMNGSIEVESVEGKGTKFTFSVLLGKSEQDIGETVFLNYSVFKGKRIMIVDDHAVNRNIVRIYLEELGCMVDESENAMEAIAKIVAQNTSIYDAIIVDYNMPNMNGYDLAAALKAIPASREIPLILLTSMGIRGEASKAQNSGFAAYISKPFKRSELLDCIAMAVGAEDIPAGGETGFVTRHTVREQCHKHGTSILLVEDNEISRSFMVNLLKINGFSCDLAVDGREAVKACEEKDYDIVFMDCQMPVMDGYEATRAIREREKSSLKYTPIVAITAYAMKGDEEVCLKAGMDDYLSKPVTSEQIIKVIKKYTARG